MIQVSNEFWLMISLDNEKRMTYWQLNPLIPVLLKGVLNFENYDIHFWIFTSKTPKMAKLDKGCTMEFLYKIKLLCNCIEIPAYTL